MSAKTRARDRVHDWSELMEMQERLNSTIMFTMIRFCYSVLASHFTDAEIGLICLVSVIASAVSMRFSLDAGTKLLMHVVFSLTSGLVSQSIINISTNNSRLMTFDIHSPASLLIDFVVVTSLLLGAAILPDSLTQMPYINRAITILLYMYTDATEFIVTQLNMSIAPVFICIFLYVILIRFHDALATHRTLQYLLKALNMCSINVVLASAGAVNNNTSDRHTFAVILLIILFSIEALHRVTGVLQEGRDFAVWKGSKLLFELYSTLDFSIVSTLSAAVLFVVFKHVAGSRNSTLVEVFLLVSVNAILDNLSQYTASAFNFDKILTLFMYTIVIHSVHSYYSAK